MTAPSRGPAYAGVVCLRVLLGFSLWLLSAVPANAQAVQLQAGSSSLFGAHGASIETRGPTHSFAFGAGRIRNRFTIGALMRKVTHGVTFSVGDDTLDFQLPTDVFGGSHYLPVRGAGLDLTRRNLHIRGVVGAATQNTGAPFFRGAEWGGPSVGMLFLDQKITPRLRAVSRSIFADTQTSIHGVEWTPRDKLTLGATAGVGGNKFYAAASGRFKNDWVTTTAAQISGRSSFRRINLDSPGSSETTGTNVSATFHPRDWWSVSAGRQNLLDGDGSAPVTRRVAVNNAGLTVNRLGFRTGLNAFESRGHGLNNQGLSLSVARNVTRAVDVEGNYFRARSGDGDRSQSLLVSLRETLTPRVSLLQVITRSGNQTSMNVGGQFLSNPLTVSVTYQNVYAPFHPGNPFVQAVGVDLRINVLDRVQLQAGTYTTPDGRLRYSISGSTIAFRQGRRPDTNENAFKARKYAVRGQVTDETGQPIPGATVQIGDDVLITNGEGRFVLRVENPSPRDFKVLTDEFMMPGRFEVVSAPTKVAAVLDHQVRDVRVTLRRV